MEKNKFCQNSTDCDLIKGFERTKALFQKRIDERNAVLEEISGIIGLTDGLTIHDIPEKLKEFLDTRGDKAKIVAENKRLLRENQEMAYELYKLKQKNI